jgi:hypothetical protein
MTYDSIRIIDRLMEKAVDVPALKKAILAGVEGEYSTYSFEPNGEVIGAQYLKTVEK